MDIKLPESLQFVVDNFSRLPGVGRKTALRQVLNITDWNSEEVENFRRSLLELKKLKKCTACGFFAEQEMCEICLHPKRSSASEICVVDSIQDFMAIERSGEFKGLYHILTGVLNPLSGVGPREIGIDKLVERVKQIEAKRLILALTPSVEGDATCSYISDELRDYCEIQRIGFGIPIGGSLEYLDPLTIGKALENRKNI